MVSRMRINNRTIFLLDGLGAVLSTLLLGVCLPLVQPWLGMPLGVLYLLAVLPLCYGVYSFGCYALVDHEEPRWLVGIITANTLYCVLTMSLLFVHAGDLTPLGIVYFVVEALVILGVVALEVAVLRRSARRRDGSRTGAGGVE